MLQANNLILEIGTSNSQKCNQINVVCVCVCFFIVCGAYPGVRVRIPYPSTYPYLSTGKENVRGTGEY